MIAGLHVSSRTTILARRSVAYLRGSDGARSSLQPRIICSSFDANYKIQIVPNLPLSKNPGSVQLCPDRQPRTHCKSLGLEASRVPSARFNLPQPPRWRLRRSRRRRRRAKVRSSQLSYSCHSRCQHLVECGLMSSIGQANRHRTGRMCRRTYADSEPATGPKPKKPQAKASAASKATLKGVRPPLSPANVRETSSSPAPHRRTPKRSARSGSRPPSTGPRHCNCLARPSTRVNRSLMSPAWTTTRSSCTRSTRRAR